MNKKEYNKRWKFDFLMGVFLTTLLFVFGLLLDRAIEFMLLVIVFILLKFFVDSNLDNKKAPKEKK